MMRKLLRVALAGLWLLTGAVAQNRPRSVDVESRADAEDALRKNFDSYRKKVKAPNGQEIDLTPTLRRLADGRSLQDAGLRPHAGDGTTFLNIADRASGVRPLPPKPRGYYTEFVVPPNDGARWPGPQRLILGRNGEAYYSPDHYDPKTIVALQRSAK
jgi:guanyl-specific ribonuclease Sa